MHILLTPDERYPSGRLLHWERETLARTFSLFRKSFPLAMRALSSSLPLLSSAALLFALSSSFRTRLSSGVSASSRTLCSVSVAALCKGLWTVCVDFYSVALFPFLGLLRFPCRIPHFSLMLFWGINSPLCNCFSTSFGHVSLHYTVVSDLLSWIEWACVTWNANSPLFRPNAWMIYVWN